MFRLTRGPAGLPENSTVAAILATFILSSPVLAEQPPMAGPAAVQPPLAARPAEQAGARIQRMIGILDSIDRLCASIKERAGAASLSSTSAFQYTYTFEPKGERYWSRTSPSEWVERYSTGEQTMFRVVGRDTVDGSGGTVVRRADGGIEVFIPDTGATLMWARSRPSAAAPWSFIAAMTHVRSEADRFVTVDLKPIANYTVDHIGSFPTGLAQLGGVPFNAISGARNSLMTQGRDHPDYPTSGTVRVAAANPVAVHLLLNGTYVLPEFKDRKVGAVDLEFADGARLSVPIVAYQSVRETWSFAGQAPVMNPPQQGVRWRNVFQEKQDRGGAAIGFLDTMTILIPAERTNSTLSSITLLDTSTDTVGGLDPGLCLMAITVETR